MRTYNFDNYKKIAILGSFGKHYDLIVDTASIFSESQFQVLVPKLAGIQSQNNGFIILNGDATDDPRELEVDYLNNCLDADCVYVCNMDGYIGTTVAFELGVLVNCGQEVYFMQRPSDKLFCSMMSVSDDAVYAPSELIAMMNAHNSLWNSREWFDGERKFEDIPFALTKKKRYSKITKVDV